MAALVSVVVVVIAERRSLGDSPSVADGDRNLQAERLDPFGETHSEKYDQIIYSQEKKIAPADRIMKRAVLSNVFNRHFRNYQMASEACSEHSR